MRLLFCFLTGKITEDYDGILYTSSNFTPSIWNRYLSLADELHVIMTKSPNIVSREEAEKKLFRVDTQRIYVHNVPHNKDSFKHFFSPNIKRTRWQIIDEQVGLADAVIIRDPHSEIINSCIKHKKPYAVEVIGCAWDSLWNHSIKGKILALPMFIDLKISVKNAPYVIYVTNNFLQKRYPTNGVSVGCSDVLLNDIDESVYQRRLDKIKNHSGKIVVGTAAALNVKYKGQRFVIRALAELKKQGITNFEYQVIGGGDAISLINEAEKYGVSEQFKVIGQLNHDKVFEWLESIDIYIQPSLQEGLPRAVVEAMSCGVPCMGFCTAGIPELLDKSMICHKRDSHEIAEKLKSFDKEKMLKLAEYSFNKSKEYDKDVLDKRRNNFYNDFLNKYSNG